MNNAYVMEKLKFVDKDRRIIIVLYQIDINEYQLVIRIKDKEERIFYRNKGIAEDMFWYKARLTQL